MVRILTREMDGVHTPSLIPGKAPEPWGGDLLRLAPWREDSRGYLLSRAAAPDGDIILAGSCSSVLDAAHILAREGELGEWGSLLAASQWGGRGRAGREWSSSFGNLHAAFILPPVPEGWSNLSGLLTGYLLSLSLNYYGYDTALKWPNDILFRGLKCGGVLTEEKRGRLLAGVGLNLNAVPETGRISRFKPGSLRDDGAPLKSPLFTWSFLVKKMKKMYYKLAESGTVSGFLESLSGQMAFSGSRVTLRDPRAGVVSGYLIGIDKGGALRVSLDGKEERFTNAEIISAAAQLPDKRM